MKFGAMVATKIDDWQLIQFAENLGYDSGWVPDSQMIWSDCYAVLALAAHHTSRIRLGTGVAIPGTRIAPVTAHSIASINRLAPGRVFLGIGTGHTAQRVMGFDPMKPGDFREYLRVVRGLLNGEEVEYAQGGETRSIRFLHQELGFIDTAHRIPIYVAANGPLALKAAGAFGDGRVSAGNEPPPVLRRNLERVYAGAEAVGGSMGEDFHTAALSFSCVLEPGESLTSQRVIDEVGSMVASSLHFWWELYQQRGNDDFVQPAVRDVWENYLDYVSEMATPEDRRYQQIHEGHCTYLMPEERRFMVPELIRASGGLVGEPDEIIAALREMEACGLKEVTLLPPMASARKCFEDFAQHVIARY
jgi:alkanesulfonate monooxygenase SsuD/methylene tetrahydromethanopterin reductase-like flavin-dependent oxidoreductase (luciferase family)